MDEKDFLKPLGTVIVNLSLTENQLRFEGVSARMTANDDEMDATDIMYARTEYVYEKAKTNLKTGKQPELLWRDSGLIQRGDQGELNFPGRPQLGNPRPKVGPAADPNHHPIVLFAEFGEALQWKIKGYGKGVCAVVTGDPTAYGKGPAPDFKDLFADSVFRGTGSASTGPIALRVSQEGRLLDPNYVFFKYHVILLDSPWATHDPDVICGTPIR